MTLQQYQVDGHWGILAVVCKQKYQIATAGYATDVNTVVVCIVFEEMHWTMYMCRVPTIMVQLYFMDVEVIWFTMTPPYFPKLQRLFFRPNAIYEIIHHSTDCSIFVADLKMFINIQDKDGSPSIEVSYVLTGRSKAITWPWPVLWNASSVAQ